MGVTSKRCVISSKTRKWAPAADFLTASLSTNERIVTTQPRSVPDGWSFRTASTVWPRKSLMEKQPSGVKRGSLGCSGKAAYVW